MDEEVVNVEGQVLIRGNLRIDWDELGEGWNGDWDPDDPDDVELLRFSVYRLEGGEWVEADDASYCTQVPVATAAGVRQRLLEGLMDEIDGARGSIKKLCERLSWIDPTWYEPCEHTNCHMDARTTVGGKRLCDEHGREFTEFLAADERRG